MADSSNKKKKNSVIIGGPSGDASNKLNRKHENTSKRKPKKVIIAELTELANIDSNLDIYKNSASINENGVRTFNKETIFMIEPGYVFTADDGNRKYIAISKLGYGGFSLVWLAYDLENKMFKALKVFMYGQSLNKKEIMTLKALRNQQNILHYDGWFTKNDDIKGLCYFAVYEPLGKTLQTLLDEASKYGGLPVKCIKKLAYDIVCGLEKLHQYEMNGMKVNHTDIKPNNIAISISQKSIYDQLRVIVNERKSMDALRMECQKGTKLDGENVRNLFTECLNGFSYFGSDVSTTSLTFKLIDFGNILREGTVSETGTYGYRPPEQLFAMKISCSYDIWSFGITLLECFISKRFIGFKTSTEKSEEESELDHLRKIFGKFPRHLFFTPQNQKDPIPTLIEKFTKAFKDSKKLGKFENSFKEAFGKKLEKCSMKFNEKMHLVDFLFHMLNYDQSKRKPAPELLKHIWLKNKAMDF